MKKLYLLLAATLALPAAWAQNTIISNSATWSSDTNLPDISVLAVNGAGNPVLTIDSGSAAAWNSQGALFVGAFNNAPGQVVITNGSTLSVVGTGTNLGSIGDVSSATSGTVVIGAAANSPSSITVTGAGSSISSSLSFSVGGGSTGLLEVRDGGEVDTAALRIGSSGAKGTVLINGQNSKVYSSSGDLGISIGARADGTLLITNGGRLESGTLSPGIPLVETHSEILVTGTGSVWTNQGTATLGGQGFYDDTAHTRLTVADHGEVHIGDKISVSTAASSITIEKTASMTAKSLDGNSGSLTIDGTLTLDGGAGTVTISHNSSGGTIGGTGRLEGNLSLENKGKWTFSLDGPLTVTGTVSIYSGFGIKDITGLNSSVAIGTYTLIENNADFDMMGLANWGEDEKYSLGNDKFAYFEKGSLDVVVIPEPKTYALLLLGLAALLLQRKQHAQTNEAL